MKKVVVLLSLGCLLAALSSCSGSNSTVVFVSPTGATVNAGATLQFTANVAVSWMVSGDGSIDAAGFFRAGNAAETVTITAIAKDGSGSSGTATVTVSTTGTTTSTTTTSSPSGISHRVFVSNKYSGVLNIVDADADLLSTHTVIVGGAPTFMLQTSDLTAEVVYDSTNNLLGFVDNATETVSAKTSPLMTGTIQSAAIIPGATLVYAAVPTAVPSGSSTAGSVYQMNFSSGVLSVGVPGVRYLSIDHNAVHMLAFSQSSDTVTLVTSSSGTLTSNTGRLIATPLPASTSGCSTSFSRPVAAVFSNDDSTAYVLNSGPINGALAPGQWVSVLDMTQSPPACQQTISVSGANVGLLQGTQLYVAGALASCTTGTAPTCQQQAVLTVINTSTNTAGSPVPFGPAAPNLVPGVLTFDGTNLWIGSTGCQVSAGAPGCLSLYSPAGAQILATNILPGVLTDQSDDITGMVWLQPFNGRNIMYVIEGGALIVYDNFFDNLTQIPGTQESILFITGQGVSADAVK